MVTRASRQFVYQYNHDRRKIKEQNPRIRIVCLSPRDGAETSWGDETVNSHDPAALLKMLEEIGGRTDI